MEETPEKFDTGLVLGKFYPLTKGHQYLIESAQRRCRRLFVAIGSRPDETIPPETRATWIRELYPAACVVVQPDTLPYFPSECASVDEFYRIWATALREVCGDRAPDVLFTSEDYGDITAQYLRCRHILVDKDRQTFPISATEVRRDPFGHWEFIDSVVRAYYVKTICLFGPESTGKSTLCEQLARQFQTVWQPEWARDYLGERHCEYTDMETIAREHFRAHEQYKRRANRLLFMDTDAITTLVYSEHYYQRVPPLVRELADRMNQCVSLYLFSDIDIPWVPDTSRDLGTPHLRAVMRDKLLRQLDARRLPYAIITGRGAQRLDRAVQTVREYLRANS